MIAAAFLEIARATQLEDELSRRGIKLSAGTVERYGPCPVCGGTDRFSINTKKQVWNCRRCGARGGDAIALVRFLDGVGFPEAIETLCASQPGQGNYHPAAPTQKLNGNRELALRLWQQASDPRGTLVEAYLRSRRLELPYEAANEAIRFHPACPLGGEHFPAMVCLVRNIVTNEQRGVHRTALAADGTAVKRDGKTFRMSLGPIAGGAIKIDPDEDVTQGLCIGEGVETCVSGRQLGLQPVWSVISVGGIERFPVLAGIDGLAIIRENDCVSAKAVEACARRWFEAGREVTIVTSELGSDLNDELRGAIQ
jgi:hypothetical protein